MANRVEARLQELIEAWEDWAREFYGIPEGFSPPRREDGRLDSDVAEHEYQAFLEGVRFTDNGGLARFEVCSARDPYVQAELNKAWEVQARRRHGWSRHYKPKWTKDGELTPSELEFERQSFLAGVFFEQEDADEAEADAVVQHVVDELAEQLDSAWEQHARGVHDWPEHYTPYRRADGCLVSAELERERQDFIAGAQFAVTGLSSTLKAFYLAGEDD